jgi:hypothetical protein
VKPVATTTTSYGSLLPSLKATPLGVNAVTAGLRAPAREGPARAVISGVEELAAELLRSRPSWQPLPVVLPGGDDDRSSCELPSAGTDEPVFARRKDPIDACA